MVSQALGKLLAKYAIPKDRFLKLPQEYLLYSIAVFTGKTHFQSRHGAKF